MGLSNVELFFAKTPVGSPCWLYRDEVCASRFARHYRLDKCLDVLYLKGA